MEEEVRVGGRSKGWCPLIYIDNSKLQEGREIQIQIFKKEGESTGRGTFEE